MGGWGSGRTGGRPTVEAALTIDLAALLKRGWIAEGSHSKGTLRWSRGGEQVAIISHETNMIDPENAWLKLAYRNKRSGEWVSQQQHIALCYTVPTFGGRRWWMRCPVGGARVGKLHLPAGGDIFASQQAWRLGYHIQRVAERDRAFERLFRLQRKLGCDPGWEAGIHRPKGMHRTTFERHFERYVSLEEDCAAAMAPIIAKMLRLESRR